MLFGKRMQKSKEQACKHDVRVGGHLLMCTLKTFQHTIRAFENADFLTGKIGRWHDLGKLCAHLGGSEGEKNWKYDEMEWRYRRSKNRTLP